MELESDCMIEKMYWVVPIETNSVHFKQLVVTT